jgi:hypothetical protein
MASPEHMNHARNFLGKVQEYLAAAAARREREAPAHKSVHKLQARGRTNIRIRPLILVAGAGFEPATSGL